MRIISPVSILLACFILVGGCKPPPSPPDTVKIEWEGGDQQWTGYVSVSDIENELRLQVHLISITDLPLNLHGSKIKLNGLYVIHSSGDLIMRPPYGQRCTKSQKKCIWIVKNLKHNNKPAEVRVELSDAGKKVDIMVNHNLIVPKITPVDKGEDNLLDVTMLVSVEEDKVVL